MLTRFRIPLLVAISILILASCKKTNKQGRFAPKDAAIVVHMMELHYLPNYPGVK